MTKRADYMSKDEFKRLCADVYLPTQVAAAIFLDVETRTIRNYETGRTQVPKLTALILRTMVRYKFTPKKMEAILAGKRVQG